MDNPLIPDLSYSNTEQVTIADWWVYNDQNSPNYCVEVVQPQWVERGRSDCHSGKET